MDTEVLNSPEVGKFRIKQKGMVWHLCTGKVGDYYFNTRLKLRALEQWELQLR